MPGDEALDVRQLLPVGQAHLFLPRHIAGEQSLPSALGAEDGDTLLVALPAAAHGGVERQLGLAQRHLTRLCHIVDRDALLRRLGLDLLAQRAVRVHIRDGDGPDPDPVQKLRHAPGVVLVEMR